MYFFKSSNKLVVSFAVFAVSAFTVASASLSSFAASKLAILELINAAFFAASASSAGIASSSFARASRVDRSSTRLPASRALDTTADDVTDSSSSFPVSPVAFTIAIRFDSRRRRAFAAPRAPRRAPPSILPVTVAAIAIATPPDDASGHVASTRARAVALGARARRAPRAGSARRCDFKLRASISSRNRVRGARDSREALAFARARVRRALASRVARACAVGEARVRRRSTARVGKQCGTFHRSVGRSTASIESRSRGGRARSRRTRAS